MIGADSLATPSVLALKQWGCRVYAGYLGRNLTRGLVQQCQQNGIVVLPIYEETGRPTNYADGQQQGRRAAALISAIPELHGYGCAFTDDVSGASYPTVQSWCQGIASTFGAHRVYYGPSDKGDALVDAGIMHSVWVEGAWSFSPGYSGRNPQPPASRHRCGTQYPQQPNVGGVAVDLNDFVSTPWLPGSLTGVTTTITEGGLMADDVATLRADIADLKATIGTWDNDTRAEIVKALTDKVIAAGLTSRQFTFRVNNAATVWLVAFGEQGAVRMAIPDQAALYALIDIGAISPDLSIDELDQGRAAALLAIRIVPWTAA